MNEVELKYKINNFDEIIKLLEQRGCVFSEEIIQSDTVYMNNDCSDLMDIKTDTVTVRIRTLNNRKTTLTLKQRGEEKFYCKEIEFEVENSAKVHEFLEHLNLKKVIEFTKTRITTKYNNFNICLDRINELGDFIEIEIVSDNNNIALIKKEILEFANEINLNEENIETRYYPQLVLLKKRGMMKNDKKN